MSKAKLYLGQAGHLYVMSELLNRGWNVAIPEVDAGDDIFVVRDSNGDLKRVQVKTATGKPLKRDGFTAQFNIRLNQLLSPITPDIHYVFVVRYNGSWKDLVIVTRTELYSIHEEYNIGSITKDNIIFKLSYKTNIAAKAHNLDAYKNNWINFPIINH
jgi:hypothetical protein